MEIVIAHIEIDLSDEELGRIVLNRALKMMNTDDPGVDWKTGSINQHYVYAGNEIVFISHMAGILVDAANYLMHGKRLIYNEETHT